MMVTQNGSFDAETGMITVTGDSFSSISTSTVRFRSCERCGNMVLDGMHHNCAAWSGSGGTVVLPTPTLTTPDPRDKEIEHVIAAARARIAAIRDRPQYKDFDPRYVREVADVLEQLCDVVDWRVLGKS